VIRRALALVVGAIVGTTLAAPACDKRKPEPGGFGPWSFSKSKRSNVKTGRCDPHQAEDGRTMTWCFGGAAYQIGKRPAELDLYFLGTEPDAPLVEIQMKIRGCHEQDLDHWMRSTYGNPAETHGPVSYYQNAFLFAAAFIPSAPGRCLVHFLPLSEAAEIGRIKQKAAAAAPPGAGSGAGSGSGS
jgi:hypothetical protein